VLGNVVGTGGMGTVYEATDADGRLVALKLLHPGIAADPNNRERLHREVAILQKLHVDGVARVLDAELDLPEAFLVTEYVAGPTLAERVDGQGPLEPEELVDLTARLADILAEVHAAGVIHRDIKPGNVILGEHGPVLIDFGIAQEGEATRLTGTGLVIGTPGYVAPELILGGQPSGATDEWGLAAVVTYATTGRPPFGEGMYHVVLSRVTTGAVDLLGVPDNVADLLRAALAVDPALRPAPADLAAALAEALFGEPEPDALGGPDVPAADAAAWDPPDLTDAFPGPALPSFPPAVPTAAVDTDLADDDWLAFAPPPAPPRPPASGPVAPAPGRVRRPAPPSASGATLAGRAPVPPTWPAPGARPPGTEAAAGPVPMPWPVNPWATRPRPPRRGLVAAALGLTCVALGSVNVWVGAVLAGVILLFGRTAGLGHEVLRGWRARRGPRPADSARIASSVPFLLIRALFGLLPAGAVGGLLGWGTQWGVLRLLGDPGDPTPGAAAWARAAGFTIGLIVVWLGPGADLTRYGAMRLLGSLARSRRAAAIGITVALVVAALVVVGWVTAGSGGWRPPLP
jgi:predicted Ser/Thr protein kinase